MKKFTFPVLLLTMAVLATVLVASQGDTRKAATPRQQTDTAQERAEIEGTPAASAPGAASLTVTKDPITGRLRPATADELAELTTEDTQKAVSTSDVDLFEVASPAPGGGVMVDLQGRFKSAHQASRSAGGELLIECDSEDHENHDHEPATPIEKR